MTFKQEFLEKLHSGKGYELLLELAHRRQAEFAHLQQVYEVLQEIWLEFGFDHNDEGGPLRDDLEFVMEKVWFECPAGDSSKG